MSTQTASDSEQSSSVESTDEIPGRELGHQRIDPGLQPDNRYQLLRPHATGGLGQVSVAVDQKFGRKVAYKEIKDGGVNSTNPEKLQAHFLREAEITAQLEHPGIVPIYDVGSDPEGQPFYAMRFIEGETLRAANSKLHAAGSGQSASWWQVALRSSIKRLIEVCNAVQYAHSRGVLHRDLKPDNIMLGRFGETLVVDWGLARCQHLPDPRDRGRSDVVGTIGYMSPEQASYPEDVTTASDIYSLGAILYTVLTGKPSSKQSNIHGLRQEFADGKSPSPANHAPKAPQALVAICEKAMALYPERRYGSVSEFSQELQRWLDRDAVFAYREPLTERATRWVGRHKVSVTAGLGLVFAGLIGLAVSGYSALQREKATEENLVQVLKTTERFFEDTEDYLSGVPALSDLRLTLLRESADMHEEVLERNSDNPMVIYRTSKIYNKLTGIYTFMRRTSDADLARSRSIELADLLYEFENMVVSPGRTTGTARWWYYYLHTDNWKLKLYDNESDAEAILAEVDKLGKTIQQDHVLTDLQRLHFKASLRSFKAKAFLQLGDFESAEREYREAQEILVNIKDLNPAAFHSNQSGYAITLQYQGRQTESLDVWTALIDICRERIEVPKPGVNIKEWKGYLADGLSQRSRAFMALGQGKEAIADCEEGLKLNHQLAAEFPGLPDHAEAAATSEMDLGVIFARTGQLDKAMPHFEAAADKLELLSQRYPQSFSYKIRLAGALTNTAVTHYQRGDYSAALPVYRRALTVDRQVAEVSQNLTDKYPSVGTHLGIAATLTRLDGDYDEIKTHYDKAFGILEQLLEVAPESPTYQSKMGLAIRNFGELLSKKMDPSSDDYLRRAAELYTKTIDQTEPSLRLRIGVAQAQDNRGRSAARFHEFARSNDFLKQALDKLDVLWQEGQREDNLSVKVIKVRRLIAENYRDLQQWDKARDAFKDALRMVDEVEATDDEKRLRERMEVQQTWAETELLSPNPDTAAIETSLASAADMLQQADRPAMSKEQCRQRMLKAVADHVAGKTTREQTDNRLLSLVDEAFAGQDARKPKMQDYEALELQMECHLWRLRHTLTESEEVEACYATFLQLLQAYRNTENDPADQLTTQDYALAAFESMCNNGNLESAGSLFPFFRSHTTAHQFAKLLTAFQSQAGGPAIVDAKSNPADRTKIKAKLNELLDDVPALQEKMRANEVRAELLKLLQE